MSTKFLNDKMSIYDKILNPFAVRSSKNSLKLVIWKVCVDENANKKFLLRFLSIWVQCSFFRVIIYIFIRFFENLNKFKLVEFWIFIILKTYFGNAFKWVESFFIDYPLYIETFKIKILCFITDSVLQYIFYQKHKD